MKQQLGRLGKSTLVYGVGGVLNRFLNFLLLPVFTAYLSPADYGVISIVGVVAFLVTSIFSLGFGAATAPCYFESNNQARKEATIWTAFTILAVSTSVLAVVGVVFSRQISELAFQTPEYHYLVMVSLLSACLSILSEPWGLYLRFEERAKMFVTLVTISTLVSIGLSVIMVVVLRRGLLGMIEGSFIAQAFTLFLYMLVTAPGLRFRFDLTLGRELLRLGIPLIPSFAFLFVMHQGNKYVLQWFHGLEAVGVYTIGFNLGMGMGIAVNAFTNAWLPYFMSFIDKKEEARNLFGRILTYYVVGFGALNVLLFIVAKPVVMIMTQPVFHEAYKAVGFSASAQFLVGLFSILLPGVYFAKDVKYITLVQAGSALISVGFNLLLIPPFGLLGAAIALMLGTLSMVILQQAWNFRRRHDYLNVHYEWDRILAFGLVYVAYAVLMLWQRNLPLLGEVVISTVGIVLLLLVLYGLLNSSERKVVRNIAKRLRPLGIEAIGKAQL